MNSTARSFTTGTVKRNTPFVSGSGLAFLLKLSSAILGLVSSILLSRLIGPAGVGVYYLALALVNIGSILARLGLDLAILKHASACVAMGRWGQLSQVYFLSTRLILFTSSFVTFVLMWASPILSLYLFKTEEYSTLLRILSVSILPFNILVLHVELLKSASKVNLSLIIHGIAIPLLSSIFMLLFPQHINSTTACAVYTVCTMLSMSWAVFGWKRVALPVEPLDQADFKGFLLTGGPFLAIALINVILDSLDKIMLGIWMDSQSTGIYATASRIAFTSSLILVAVNSVVGPRFAALWAQRKVSDVSRLAQQSSLLMTIAALPILLITLVFPVQLLGFFGTGFSEGAVPLVILAIGQFVALATGPSAILLMMTGHSSFHRNNLVLCLFTNILLNAWLVPKWGMVGAAIATSTSLVIKNLLGALFSARLISQNGKEEIST